MTYEELKKEKLLAMKAKDSTAVSAYNALISKLMLMATDPNHGKDITEADIANVARKTESELIEERDGFAKAGRQETVDDLNKQLEVIKKFIPTLLSAEKIAEIINGLPDKSVPVVMKYFKTNYAGQVDMKLVNETLRKL